MLSYHSCAYIYTYTHAHVHTSLHTYIHIYIRVNISVYFRTCSYIVHPCVCIISYTYIYEYKHIGTHLSTHTLSYIYTLMPTLITPHICMCARHHTHFIHKKKKQQQKIFIFETFLKFLNLVFFFNRHLKSSKQSFALTPLFRRERFFFISVLPFF